MPKRELKLLVYFARHPGTALSRDQLLLEVWGKDHRRSEKCINKLVGRLRRKFEQDPRTPRLIQTVVNVGYCFMPDEEEFIARA